MTPLARMLALTAIFALPLVAVGRASADPPTQVAFFGILLINTSPGGTTAEEEARRQAVEARLVEVLIESGRFAFVDTAPVAEKASLYSNLAHCNGCDARLAAELGADIALSGEIQKTSDLILSMTVYMRDAATGELIGGGSADIRGNTDENWIRGINYILKNRILPQ